MYRITLTYDFNMYFTRSLRGLPVCQEGGSQGVTLCRGWGLLNVTVCDRKGEGLKLTKNSVT